LKQGQKAAVAFSPLSQGLLTDKYLNGIPSDSRASKKTSAFLHQSQVKQTVETARKLNEIAQ
jgi:L-glyceraldehyde 3-phosphate reductase